MKEENYIDAAYELLKREARDETREELLIKTAIFMGKGVLWERRAKTMGHAFVISWIIFMAYALFIN